jgi:hypothetical protein
MFETSCKPGLSANKKKHEINLQDGERIIGFISRGTGAFAAHQDF